MFGRRSPTCCRVQRHPIKLSDTCLSLSGLTESAKFNDVVNPPRISQTRYPSNV